MGRMMLQAAPRPLAGSRALHPLGHEIEIVNLLWIDESRDLFGAFVAPYWRCSIVHVDAAGWPLGYFEEIRLDELLPLPDAALAF
jgi:hypothetical protein